MPLAEGVSARVAYKFSASGVITPGPGPDPATDPGPSGGQILRRVATTLALNKDTYQSNEIRSDRQIADFRHGVHRVAGNITGELSPLTYKDFFEAAHRGTWVPAVTSSNTVLTSMTADHAASTITFGGGSPLTAGFRVGMGMTFSGLTATANNNTTFIITKMAGTSGRTVSVFPAPTTAASESTFTVTTSGSTVNVPSTGFVSRKCAVEVWNQDVDIARVFTECRVGDYTISMPASGMSTCEFTFMGRDMSLYTDVAAPFFTSPTVATTTGLLAAVNGLLRVGGTPVAVITAINIKHTPPLTGDPVVGSNLVPEIFMGRHNVTGDMTAFFQDATLINDFVNETEIDVMAYLTTTSAPNSPAMSFYMPRIKLSGANLQTQGEGGQMISIPYQALLYNATAETTSGIPNTTIQVWDSTVV